MKGFGKTRKGKRKKGKPVLLNRHLKVMKPNVKRLNYKAENGTL